MASIVRASGLIAAAGVMSLVSLSGASAVETSERSKTATLSVLHAIPDGVGPVDVLADARRIARNVTPGQLRTVKVAPGNYDLSIVASGVGEGAASELLSARGIDISAGADLTVTAHLNGRREPVINIFTNKTRTVGQGMGRLTVRHLAVSPAIQVRSKGSVMFDRLRNGDEADAGLRAGTYPVRISGLAVGSPAMVRTSAKIRNAPGRSDMGNNVIVYVWGDEANGRLRTSIQEVQLDLN